MTIPPIDPGVDSRAPHTEPSFWSYARKALVALLVGVVAAGGTITAAVADDHVTLSERWAILLAVAAAIVGPAAVYATRNATKPAALTSSVLPAGPLPAGSPWASLTEPEALRAVVRAHIDGTLDLAWPDGDSDRAVVSRKLLEAMVQQHNKLTTALGQTLGPKVPRQWDPPA